MNAEEKIYEAFFELKQPKLYYNQIKEHTILSHSSLQNALEKLTKANVLDEEKTKANTFYKIKDKKLFALKFSEIAMRKFNSLSPNVKVPLKNFLKNIPENIFTIILFGSASRKEETNESDIDILVVSGKKPDLSINKKEAEITSKHPLSLFNATISQFKDNKDDIIIQARKTGFPIHKEQSFYEVQLDGYQ
ncbi:nucleotidyltransferase domain-containing protein [Candidatus Woesearchaeota archaeon]|nr:nucleotidyltransferase domain-containing protein [Candidatus Woesearchaeota archaeon]